MSQYFTERSDWVREGSAPTVTSIQFHTCVINLINFCGFTCGIFVNQRSKQSHIYAKCLFQHCWDKTRSAHVSLIYVLIQKSSAFKLLNLRDIGQCKGLKIVSQYFQALLRYDKYLDILKSSQKYIMNSGLGDKIKYHNILDWIGPTSISMLKQYCRDDSW